MSIPIYIVTINTIDDDEEFFDKPIMAFTDKEKAIKYCNKCNRWINATFRFSNWYWEDLNRYEIYLNLISHFLMNGPCNLFNIFDSETISCKCTITKVELEN